RGSPKPSASTNTKAVPQLPAARLSASAHWRRAASAKRTSRPILVFPAPASTESWQKQHDTADDVLCLLDLRRVMFGPASTRLRGGLSDSFAKTVKSSVDALVKILFTGDRDECLALERFYRPEKNIGHNIARPHVRLRTGRPVSQYAG